VRQKVIKAALPAELYDENDNVLDFNSHATGFYNSYGFQPLDADEPSSAASVPGWISQ